MKRLNRSLLGFWCIILTLLGLPWVFGYLMIDKNKYIVFSYLFTIVNSLQGTVVFLFHCIISKSVREELLKLLRKQKRRFLSNVGSSSSSNSRSPMLAGNLNRDNHNNNNHHGGIAKQAASNPALRLSSNSSSLPKLSKKMSISSSSKQVDRKNSNCSSSRNNSIYNNISEQRLFKGNAANSAGNRESFSLLSYLYKLVRPLNTKSPMTEYAGINASAINKSTSSSSSFQDQALNELGLLNRLNVDQSPFHNYVRAHISTPAHGAGKTSSDNEEACCKLLGKDQYHSTKDKKNVFAQNTLRHNLINIQSQLLNHKDHDKLLTLNKSSIPQMYFNPETASSSTLVYSDNEIAKVLNSIANNKDSTSRLLTNAIHNMRRASSQISGSSATSNNQTQSSYVPNSSSMYDSNSVSNSGKTNTYTTRIGITAPTEPPPLPPSSTMSRNSPSSSTASKKETPSSGSSAGSTSSALNGSGSNYHNGNFTEAVRFSTFKCSASNNNSANDSKSNQSMYNNLNMLNKKSQIPSIIETPIISTVNPLNSVKKNGHYDENQYLTPEYHSYSMVESDCPSESQYYCEDGGMGLEDVISNN